MALPPHLASGPQRLPGTPSHACLLLQRSGELSLSRRRIPPLVPLISTPTGSSSSGTSSSDGRLRCSAVQQGDRQSAGAAAAAEGPDSLQIEGLAQDYCDDFVCTSSPAVEQTLRAMARDLTRLRSWTMSRLDPHIVYKDPVRSFEGAEKYERHHFFADCLGQPKVLVTRMSMAARDRGVVTWRLRATVGLSNLDITGTSTFTLDLITGRVKRHEEEYDLSRCSAGAKAAWKAVRALWSASQASQDTRDQGKKVLGKLTDNSNQQEFYGDPTDPTKFYQQDDNSMKDAFGVATILAIGYLFVQAYIQLDRLDHM